VDVKQPAAPQLHIERLVLHGFSPLDAQRVRDAFSAALATPMVPAAAGARDTLRLKVADTGQPELLGRAAAQALREALLR
jgi:hypothetical protein